MDSTCWYRYARHYSDAPWIVQRPNKNVFSSERGKEVSQKATRAAVFILMIAAFWFLFFKLMIGTVHTETYLFASFSSAALSIYGKGWGVLEKFLG
jgi:hypothetical protein